MRDADTTSTTIVDALVGELVIANRILAHEGVLDDFGHVAARHPQRGDRFFLSHSRSPELVTREDILELDLNGDPVEDRGMRPYAEGVIHARVFAARPDVHATVHHHCPAILPFAVTDAVLRPIHHMGAILGGPVPIWDSRAGFGDTNMLVDDVVKADSLARALGSGRAVLMRNHGATCAGNGLRDVTFTSVRMRDNAEVQMRAMQLGSARFLSEGEIKQAERMLTEELPQQRAWDFWRARAGYSGI